MNKYIVGDKIIITKPSKKQLKLWDNSWVPNMDKYIGNEYTISHIGVYSFVLKEISYSWPLCMLENRELVYEIY